MADKQEEIGFLNKYNPEAGPNLEDAQVGATATASVTVEGQKITQDILRIDLIQPIDDHHVARILIHDTEPLPSGQEVINVAKYTDLLGKSLTLIIEAREAYGKWEPIKLSFNGLVSKVDSMNATDGVNYFFITAHSPTIAMDGAKTNKFFYDQKASDIIGAVLQNYPVTVGNTEATKAQMKFCVQYRETDYDFVMRLAAADGLFAYYNGKEFSVERASQKSTAEVNWGASLRAFLHGLGTASPEFASSVYNYEQKKTFDQDSKSLSLQSSVSGLSKVSSEASKKIYKGSGFSDAPKSVVDAQGLDRVLHNERGRAMAGMVVCQGLSDHPGVTLGRCLTVDKLGKLNGSYFVTRIHHIYEVADGYRNRFTCVPSDMAHPRRESGRPAITNLQSAVVTDNKDPEKMGRIKVTFPWSQGSDTIWVRVAVPHAGKDRGWFSLPEIDDEVLVGYEQGSPDLPVVIGAMYNKDNVPHGDTATDDNSIKGFITRSGNKIIINDKDGEEQISLVAKDGTKVILNSKDPSITVETTGDTTIKAKNITLKADSKIKLDGGQIEIISAGDVKSEASMNMATKAGIEYKIEGTMVTVKGTPIKLN